MALQRKKEGERKIPEICMLVRGAPRDGDLNYTFASKLIKCVRNARNPPVPAERTERRME
jgi:hypothetical protein